MARTESITKKLMKKAIKGSYGELNAIARRAGCNVLTVRRKLEQYPDLRVLVNNEKEVLRITQKELALNTILEALTKKPVETEKDKDRRIKVAMWTAEKLGAEEGFNPILKLETDKTNGGLNITVHKSEDFESDN